MWRNNIMAAIDYKRAMMTIGEYDDMAYAMED